MFCAYNRHRYLVSVYRTIGPLVLHYNGKPNKSVEIGIFSIFAIKKVNKYRTTTEDKP